MKRKFRSLLALVAFATLATAFIPTHAGAATVGDITVELFRADQPPYGTVRVDIHDTQLGHTLRIRRGDFEISRSTVGIGDSGIYLGEPTLRPGDVIELYRPALRAGAPNVAPINSYTVPSVSLAYADATSTVTGTVGDATQARLEVEDPCGFGISKFGLALTQGGFSKQMSIDPGSRMKLSAFNGAGDVTEIDGLTAGETPCVIASARKQRDIPPGDPAADTPYQVQLYGLSPAVANDFRLVWRRGGEVIQSLTRTGTYGEVASAIAPEPGDRIEIYRPQNAPAPTSVQVVPKVKATYDRSNRLLAIDGPEARQITVNLVDDTGDDEGSARSLGPVPAGRTLFDFAAPAPPARPGPVSPRQSAEVDWIGKTGTPRFVFTARPGDLRAPVVSALTSKRIKAASFGRRFRIRVKASEAVSGSFTLSIGRRILAVGRISQKAGIRGASATLTRAGRATIRRFTAAGSRSGPVRATLTLKVKDPAGNPTVSVRSVRLVAR